MVHDDLQDARGKSEIGGQPDVKVHKKYTILCGDFSMLLFSSFRQAQPERAKTVKDDKNLRCARAGERRETTGEGAFGGQVQPACIFPWRGGTPPVLRAFGKECCRSVCILMERKIDRRMKKWKKPGNRTIIDLDRPDGRTGKGNRDRREPGAER
jgi:hypothetical protein